MSKDVENPSRRNLLKAGAAAGVAAALPAGSAQAKQSDEGGGAAEGNITFVNGSIHTMDDENRVVSSVSIRGSRFVAVGNAVNSGPGGKVIDLNGRTMVPGLIESHTHFVSLANRPGYHVRPVAGELAV